MPVEEQVLSIFAGTSGCLDDLPGQRGARFENELHEYFRTRHTDLLPTIHDTGALPEGDALATAVQDFTDGFLAASATAAEAAAADVLASDAAAAGSVDSDETLRTE